MLPLPVSRLRRRSHNAKSAKDRHDLAYHALEVSVKLAVAAAGPLRPGALARGSFGRWVGALHCADTPLTDPRLLVLEAQLAEVTSGVGRRRESVTARQLLDALAAYRNRVMGHGAPRSTSFYDRAGHVLLEGLDAAWEAGMFLTPGQALLQIESIELGSDRVRRARVLDLRGENPVVLDAHGTVVPREISPMRLYLRDGEEWRSLHPWALYEEEAERLYFFNGRGRTAEYLDYGSGEVLRGEALRAQAPLVEQELEVLFQSGETPGGDPEPALAPADAPTTQRLGEFLVLGRLGVGGMGVVHLGLQESVGRLVALKSLPVESASDPVLLGRFRREIRAMGRCDHPNVIKVLGSGETEGRHWFAMEYVDGVDLRRIASALVEGRDLTAAVAAARGDLRGELQDVARFLPAADTESETPEALQGDPVHAWVRLFRDAARGLQHLHARGILHRDVSPANLMIAGPDARLVIMDLGVASVADGGVTLTRDRSRILGTLRYLAPEHLHAQADSPGPPADVYSLAASLYELLAGSPLHAADSEAELMKRILWDAPPPLRKLRPAAPRELEAVLEQALEKNPADRYADAAAFAAELDAFLEGRPVHAKSLSPAWRAWRGVRRHRGRAAAGLLLAVTLALGANAVLRGPTSASDPVLAELRGIATEVERLLEALPADAIARADGLARLRALQSEIDTLVAEPLVAEEAASRRAWREGRGTGGNEDSAAALAVRTALQSAADSLAAGDRDAARDLLLALEPQAVQRQGALLWELAAQAQAAGEPELARRALESEVQVLAALQIDAREWESILAHERLAATLAALGDPAAAVLALDQALEGLVARDPRSDELRRAQLKRSALLLDTGQAGAALAELDAVLEQAERRLVATHPDLILGWQLKARALDELGREAEAAGFAQRALQARRDALEAMRAGLAEPAASE
ncbi:MAG TPA: protein kinase [Planctomycetota bacterium]